MSSQWSDEVSYHTGCGGERGIAAFALTHADLAEERIDHGFVVTWNGSGWDSIQHPVDWSVAGLCRVEHPRPAWLVAGVNGQAMIVEGSSVREETIGEGEDAAGRVGFLRRARAIGGHAYAVGMCRQVYRRDGVETWSRIDHACRRPAGDPSIVGFEAIDGFAENDLYAVGLRGEVWRSDGTGWSQIASPTDIILTDVCCAGDGLVYACGRMGMLLRGRGDRWEVIDQQVTGHDLWGVAWFDGRLYAATLNYLVVFDGKDIALVTADGSPSSGYHLSATTDRLWSIGPRQVAIFDDTSWHEFD